MKLKSNYDITEAYLETAIVMSITTIASVILGSQWAMITVIIVSLLASYLLYDRDDRYNIYSIIFS